ncbi:cbb3-type cytochrome oxidase assembly protein CcoS [Massilia sp. W12]|uniref:cbb3-type cytochrome oxidase assembly protein CcoS n=1 Tax=Massilia sp. W12 TaxID=3126507 RepID=UPI0030D32609
MPYNPAHALRVAAQGVDMESLYVLVPLSVALVFLIGGVFWWALNNRQFDDLEQQGTSILQEEEQDASKNGRQE